MSKFLTFVFGGNKLYYFIKIRNSFDISKQIRDISSIIAYWHILLKLLYVSKLIVIIIHLINNINGLYLLSIYTIILEYKFILS